MLKTHLHQLLTQSLPEFDAQDIHLEHPQDSTHGDFSTNLAMTTFKDYRSDTIKSPRDHAQSMILIPTQILTTPNPITFLISTTLSVILAYLLFTSVGFIAFWVTQMTGIRQIFARLTEVLAGTMFPLHLLPESVTNITNYLPFQHIHYTPTSLYLDQITPSQAIIPQLIWITIALILHLILWNQGIKHYESVGN